MNDVLKSIAEDKRTRIINSSLEEFSKYGFNNASTNNIVEKANISKGLLYHYFTSKKELHRIIEEFAVEMAYKHVVDKIDWNISDIYGRIKQCSKIKIDLIEEYPYLFKFIQIMTYEKGALEMQKFIATISPTIYENMLTYNIDFTKFRDGINVRKAINIIQWTIEKYIDKATDDIIYLNGKVDEKLWAQIDEYIVILKQAFYKPEYIS